MIEHIQEIWTSPFQFTKLNHATNASKHLNISLLVRCSSIKPIQILVLVLLLLPFRAQKSIGLIAAMAVVTPKELTAGMARGQVVRGRVRNFDLEKKGKSDCAECHLIVEPGLSGTLYIEAWRDQAHRLGQVAKNGLIVELTDLTIKAMGDKIQWQCTNLDVYGQVMSTTRIRAVEHDDGSCPVDLHTVFVRDLHYFHKVPHMINIAAVLVDVAAPTSQKATAPAFTMVLGDEKNSVRVAIWKDHAASVNKDSATKGAAVILTNLRVTRGKDNSTEIGSSRRSKLQTAPEVMASELLERTTQLAELVSISGHYGGQDYAAAEATPIHLSALTSFIVPNQTRDFAGEVYVVYHCLVEDIEPMVDAEGIFYMGCPECKKNSANTRNLQFQSIWVRAPLLLWSTEHKPKPLAMCCKHYWASLLRLALAIMLSVRWKQLWIRSEARRST